MRLSYLSFVSYILIPFQLILLAFLALKIARKQAYFFIEKVINCKFTLNGVEIKLFPFFALISTFAMVYQYHNLMDLANDHKESPQAKANYQQILYHSYRNLLIHCTNILLVFQNYLAAKYYARYMAIKEKVEGLEKAQK